MRIAILLPRFSRYGGVEQFGYRLAGALAARKHAVDYICARQEVAAPSGVTVLATGRPPGPRWTKMLFFAARAERLRRAGGYDCTVSLGKTLGQNILRVGGGPLPQFWRYSEKAFPVGPARLWKRFRRLLNPANALARKLEAAQYANSEIIVAASRFVRDLILESFPSLPPERVKVIYNRPDLARFSPPDEEEREAARKKFGIGPHTVAIGLATSNLRLKGAAPLIRALLRLPDRCALYVAGGRNHSAYAALAGRLGLAGRVHFSGKIDAMPEWYRALDIFALPSFYDACSNAVLEALATGLPTLGSAANGSSCFLPPENIVADPGDSDELARVLSRLLAQAGENNKTGARRPFTWPEDVESGLDSFVALVEAYLTEKTGS